MTDNSPSTGVPPAQPPTAAPTQPLLGPPASEARWLLPVAVGVAVIALSMLVFVFLPLHRAVRGEPVPEIQAVLADQVFLLHLRLWPAVAIAGLIGGALSVAGARRSRRAVARLEMRLRRVAGGEFEDAPFQPGQEFAGFEDVMDALRYAIERSAKRNRAVLQQVHSPIKRLSQRLAVEELPRLEVRKAINEILAHIDGVLEADRRGVAPGKGKP